MVKFNKKGKEDEYIIGSNFEFEPSIDGLGHAFFRAMRKNKDKIAQYVAETDEKDTFDSLLTKSVRTALHIKQKNITQNDIICLCSHNQIDSCVPIIASLFLGIKAASLDPSLSINDTSHLLKQIKPRLIFVTSESVNLIENSLEEAEIQATLVVFGKSDKYEEFSEYLQPNDDENNFKPVDISSNKDTALIFFSSGTTGLPKGICLSHYALMGQAHIINENIDITIVLNYASHYWISSVLILVSSVLYGGARVLCKTFNSKEIWKILDKYKVTYAFLSTTQAIELSMNDRPEDIDTTNLLTLSTGGSSIAVKYIKILRDFLPGTFVSQVYGQTETAGPNLLFKNDDAKDAILLHNKPGSCGKPINGFWYKIVDPDTEKILGPTQHGELRLKSPLLLNGYHNMDSSVAFDSDGWLKTGDVLFYDEDQCFYFVDRIKEMLKYKSFHVAPAFLEKVINSHPAVQSSVVVGIPHEIDGDHLMGIVLLRNEDQNVQPEEIVKFVDERVSERQKLRAGVKFIKEIPTTPTGKIIRRLVRDMVLRGEI